MLKRFWLWLMRRDKRACTCHPGDNPPRPCPRKFAYSECVAAALK